MLKGRVFLGVRRRSAFSIRGFPEHWRQVIATFCVLLLIQILWTPLQGRPAERQMQLMQKATPLQPRTVTSTLAFSIAGAGEAGFSLTIGSPGQLKVTATWSGTAGSLALILNGPGQTQYYARKDGDSPLTLEFDLTQELLNSGSDWKISIVSFKPDVSAQGNVVFRLPSGSSVKQLSAQVEAAGQQATAAVAEAKPAATSKTATAEGTQTATARETTARPKPGLKDLLSKAREEKKPAETRPAELEAGPAEDLSQLQKEIEVGIQRITRETPLGGVVVPLFFKYLEEAADNPRLVREFFRNSAHKTSQNEADLRLLLQRPARAYRQIQRDFKSRYLHPALVDIKKGDRVNLKQLAPEMVQKLSPNLESRVKQIVRESFSGRYLLTEKQVLAGQKMTPVAGMQKISTRQKVVRSQTQVSRPVAQAISTPVQQLSARPTEIELGHLRQALQQVGAQIPDTLTRGSLVHGVLKAAGAEGSLRQIEGRQFETDYFRYLVTLDWFRCLDKNERSKDEPYFGLLTTLPQFDPGDTNYFRFLKDGCLNRVDSYVTRTYGGVKKNTDHGIKGDDRVVFDYLNFNSPISFTIDLWEEDYSKGAVSDAFRNMAVDIMLKIKNDIKAAMMSQIQAYIADAILSSSGVSTSGAMQLLDQIFTGSLSLADFQRMLFNLYSGRAFDVSWYLIYFLFSGGDLMQTLAMIGGGSTVVGAVLLGLAIVGPAFSDMVGAFSSGDVSAGLVNLFKIITVVPLLVDFFGTIIRSLINLFNMLMALIDPDDHLGQKTITILQTSASWRNDAADGVWQSRDFVGMPVAQADAFFARRGYGPTRLNNSLIENNLFWVPCFTIKGGDAEYVVYYEVFREKAGGRTTFGFYFPDQPKYNAKNFRYQSKSSAGAWWQNILRVSVMSLNTEETPLIFIIDKRTGRTYSNLESGNSFEFEANPGTDYDIWVMKLSGGEQAGYVSIYEGPTIDVKCPEARIGNGSGAGQPPGSRRTHLK